MLAYIFIDKKTKKRLHKIYCDSALDIQTGQDIVIDKELHVVTESPKLYILTEYNLNVYEVYVRSIGDYNNVNYKKFLDNIKDIVRDAKIKKITD